MGIFLLVLVGNLLSRQVIDVNSFQAVNGMLGDIFLKKTMASHYTPGNSKL